MIYPGKARLSALPARLAALAELLPQEGAVADIGCDHGLLSAHLAARGREVIAVDVSPAALQKTQRLVKKYKLKGLEVRRGDGLAALRVGEARAAVIAGLGGLEMIHMLECAPAVARAMESLVLQPMQGQAELRGWLAQNGYPITGEWLLRDGRLFEALLVRPGGDAIAMPPEWPPGFYDIGFAPVMRGEAEAGALIRRRLDIFQRQLDAAKAQGEAPEWLQSRVKAYAAVLAIFEDCEGNR